MVLLVHLTILLSGKLFCSFLSDEDYKFVFCVIAYLCSFVCVMCVNNEFVNVVWMDACCFDGLFLK